MTVIYNVQLANPLVPFLPSIVNVAEVDSTQSLSPSFATRLDAVAPGSMVGDRVWLDVDGDGVQDVGEVGLSNVTRSALPRSRTAFREAATRSLVARSSPTGTATTSSTASIPEQERSTPKWLRRRFLPGLLASPGNNNGRGPSLTITGNDVYPRERFRLHRSRRERPSSAIGSGATPTATRSRIPVKWESAASRPSHGARSGRPLRNRSTTWSPPPPAPAADGTYLFVGVAPGVYRVDVTDTGARSHRLHPDARAGAQQSDPSRRRETWTSRATSATGTPASSRSRTRSGTTRTATASGMRVRRASPASPWPFATRAGSSWDRRDRRQRELPVLGSRKRQLHRRPHRHRRSSHEPAGDNGRGERGTARGHRRRRERFGGELRLSKPRHHRRGGLERLRRRRRPRSERAGNRRGDGAHHHLRSRRPLRDRWTTRSSPPRPPRSTGATASTDFPRRTTGSRSPTRETCSPRSPRQATPTSSSTSRGTCRSSRAPSTSA